ncbi:trypanothione synthetase [Trypanosoma rangeli SC58]|uniref:Trypanothione synthetase n=1 Tax=Trypanosoma rangeli SC58 TaxID=429131 RepID=A0A061J2R6_TRYRA|nr:trypanothione synthetase [Trypanosoma rangeli SC58]
MHMAPDKLAGQSLRRVPIHGICGYAPGSIPAYSNGMGATITAERHYERHYFMGYKWQCVEFARRWLFYRKGLALPQYDFAAHLIHLQEVRDVCTGAAVPCRFIPQGSTEPPEADGLIVYPGCRKNIVGHVGVITHVTSTSVQVADQNRFFHHWGDNTFSAEFPLECVEDRYYIRDPDAVECRGWIVFPGRPNRLDGKPLQLEPHMSGPPSLPCARRVAYVAQQLWSWCTGRETPTFSPL